MLTTNKLVTNELRDHILSYFEYEVSDNQTEFNTLNALKEQIRYMQNSNESDYDTAYRLVQGGQFLIYYQDVTEFLNSLNINDKNKTFTDDQAWRLYCHLLARETVKLINKRG